MSSIDIGGARRKLGAVERQVRFATARALTMTAKDAQGAVTADLDSIFDQPVRFTRQAIAILPARRETLEAWVLVKDRQAEYLALQETGGLRMPRPGAPVLVPVGIRTNRSGNIPRGAVARTVAKPDSFVAGGKDARTRHLPPGIYRRMKRRGRGRAPGRLKLLASLERRAAYRPRFGFRRRVVSVVLDRFPRNFAEALRQALATAK